LRPGRRQRPPPDGGIFCAQPSWLAPSLIDRLAMRKSRIVSAFGRRRL
jgi:hypothetical protein